MKVTDSENKFLRTAHLFTEHTQDTKDKMLKDFIIYVTTQFLKTSVL